MRAVKPGEAEDEIKTLTDDGVTAVIGEPGRYRSYYLADGIDGDYNAIFTVTTQEGLIGIEVVKTRVKNRPT
jgi:hypothetical protein